PGRIASADWARVALAAAPFSFQRSSWRARQLGTSRRALACAWPRIQIATPSNSRQTRPSASGGPTLRGAARDPNRLATRAAIRREVALAARAGFVEAGGDGLEHAQRAAERGGGF